MSRKIRGAARTIELPVWKKALFSSAAVALFFCLVEGILALAGVRPARYSDDPYVGFSGAVDLFVLRDGSYVTSPAKRDWFNDQSFPSDKAAGAYRVFSVGGSTTYGRPYDDRGSFSGWLREMLAEVDSDRKWEVINAGGISYASYRVALLMEELTRYEPDLFIVYTGHNEFLERRTYSPVLGVPRFVTRLGGLAARLRLFAVGKRLLEGGARGRTEQSMLPGEVDTILEHSVGPAAYSRDEQQRQLAVEHFQFNLNRMIDIARSAGARVVLIAPESNLRSCSPFKSQAGDGLKPRKAAHLQRLLEEADSLEDAKAALELLDRAVSLDPRYAEARYRRGRALFALGRYEEARSELEQALEEDVCPLRAVAAIRKAVIRTAAERDVLLVDVSDRLRRLSEGGIPGEEIFLDHVHMTAEGYGLMAQAVLEALVRTGVARSMPSPEARARAGERVRARIDYEAQGRALRNLAKVLDWAGKHEDAGRLARQSAAILGEDPDAFSVLGHTAARRGDMEEAERYFRRAVQLTAGRAEPFYDWGTALLDLGRTEEAVAALEQAVALDPAEADAQFNLGLALHRSGRTQDAEARLRQALELDPASVDAAVNLTTLLVEAGRAQEAAVVLEQVSRDSPEDARLELAKGIVLVALGRSREAVNRYQAAIRLDPGFPDAHRNLGATYLLLDKRRLALESLLQALELLPTAETHTHLGNAYMLAGHPGKAAEHFEKAIGLRPDWPAPRIHWAWFLASHPDRRFRDGPRAVELAVEATRLTHRQDPQALDSLAAAFAEIASYSEAAETARQALVLLEKLGLDAEAQEVRQRLNLYRAQRAYRTDLRARPSNSSAGAPLVQR